MQQMLRQPQTCLLSSSSFSTGTLAEWLCNAIVSQGSVLWRKKKHKQQEKCAKIQKRGKRSILNKTRFLQMLPHSCEHKNSKLVISQVCTVAPKTSACFAGRGVLRFHKVGNPEVLPVSWVVHSWGAALIHLPEGTKWRTLLVSMAGRVMNAHFLSPNDSPQINPSWLCYPVLMSVRSPLLPCSALFLTASQTHAVTQPHSACHSLSYRWVLVPSFLSALSSPPVCSLWQGIVGRGEPYVKTHLFGMASTTMTARPHASPPQTIQQWTVIVWLFLDMKTGEIKTLLHTRCALKTSGSTLSFCNGQPWFCTNMVYSSFFSIPFIGC